MKQIPLFKVYMSNKASEEVTKVLTSGFIGQGPKVEEFEEMLRQRFRHEYLVTTNSGTSAEHLAIRLLQKPAVNQKNFDGMAYWDSKWPGIQPGNEN